MKTIATAAAAAALLATTATTYAGSNGSVDYSWELSTGTASLGDTVSLTLMADFTAESASFYALAMAEFDIIVTDTVVNGGSIGNNAVHPAFDTALFGDPGQIVGDDILQITAEQFPAAETGSLLALYTFEFTVVDGTPRLIDFDLANEDNLVFTTPNFLDPIVPYDASMTTGQLEIVGVPAPGAMALLGIAGIVGGRRRRRDERG